MVIYTVGLVYISGLSNHAIPNYVLFANQQSNKTNLYQYLQKGILKTQGKFLIIILIGLKNQIFLTDPQVNVRSLNNREDSLATAIIIFNFILAWVFYLL